MSWWRSNVPQALAAHHASLARVDETAVVMAGAMGVVVNAAAAAPTPSPVRPVRRHRWPLSPSPKCKPPWPRSSQSLTRLPCWRPTPPAPT